MVIDTREPEALKAVHDFLRYQAAGHKTGDPAAVKKSGGLEKQGPPGCVACTETTIRRGAVRFGDAQGDVRVHAGRTARREVAGEQRRQQQRTGTTSSIQGSTTAIRSRNFRPDDSPAGDPDENSAREPQRAARAPISTRRPSIIRAESRLSRRLRMNCGTSNAGWAVSVYVMVDPEPFGRACQDPS